MGEGGRGGEGEDEKNNSFGDGLREPKPSFSFVFSIFPWPGGLGVPGESKTIAFSLVFQAFRMGEGGRARGRRRKKNNSFGDGLREPKPSFSFVFSMFPKPGGPGESENIAFSLVFHGFGVGGGAREKKKKIVSATA